MNRERIVIIGASLTGATAAATLREEGFDGAIDLIGAEAKPPYNRPPLSKEYLRGQARFEDQLVKPADYYAEQSITLRLGVRANAVDSKRKVVELDGGEQIAYDRLLVATGGRNRPLSGPGTAMEGLFQLRTVEDCDRIRAAARAGARVAVVGLGFIGSEVAASLRQLGLEVAAVEGHPVPLARVLGEEVGKVLADIHRENGVDLALGDSVAAFEGGNRVERVRTKNGRRLECDLVVAGIGIMPNSELLAASGAAVDNGVLVDERCRTSLPDVYAAGDVANHLHPVFGRLRVEHWNNGYQQGRAAARSMLGRDQPYDYLAFLLVEPVRPRDRIRGLCGPLGPSRLPRAPREPEVSWLLSERRRRARRGRSQSRRRSGRPEGGRGAEGRGEPDPQPCSGRPREAGKRGRRPARLGDPRNPLRQKKARRRNRYTACRAYVFSHAAYAAACPGAAGTLSCACLLARHRPRDDALCEPGGESSILTSLWVHA